jgi:hypothetical protein
MFLPDSGWKEMIVSHAVSQAQFKDHTVIEKNVEALVVAPRRWILGSDGLSFLFNADEVACHACTPVILIPWAELKGVLRPDAPIPK